MSRYAEDTKVPKEKTMGEIQSTLHKYGANNIAWFQGEDKAGLVFEMLNRRLKFLMVYPPINNSVRTKNGRWRDEDQQRKHHEQLIRQKWRALLLTIKAKLESSESGIETFEEAFMANIVMPNGQTMSEWATPQINQCYENGKMPPLLQGF